MMPLKLWLELAVEFFWGLVHLAVFYGLIAALCCCVIAPSKTPTPKEQRRGLLQEEPTHYSRELSGGYLPI